MNKQTLPEQDKNKSYTYVEYLRTFAPRDAEVIRENLRKLDRERNIFSIGKFNKTK